MEQYGTTVSWTLGGSYGPVTLSTTVKGADMFAPDTDYSKYEMVYNGETYVHMGTLKIYYNSNNLWGSATTEGAGSIGIPNDLAVNHDGHHVKILVRVHVYWINYAFWPYQEDYEVNFVLGDDIPSDTDCWLTVEKGTTVFGDPYWLTISASSGGTTNPTPGSYVYDKGTSVTVTATPSSGYYFSYWSLDGTVYYNNPITVTMTADHSLTAYFYYPSGGGGGGCVLYNTRILMADDKEMPIQTIKPGDEIMGYDVQSGAFVTETVTSNEHTIVDEILSINDGLLQVTQTDQPIYTDHGWVKNPQDLVIGWRIYDPVHNSWITIQSLETLKGHFPVYDLRATKPNTFIGNGVLLDWKALLC
jgi:hypothetical protein